MVHYRLRRKCLTVNIIRLLGGVAGCHSATTVNGRCFYQEGKHELHMIINFGQVNTSYVSSFTAIVKCKIMCICEGDSLYCWPFSCHNGLFI